MNFCEELERYSAIPHRFCVPAHKGKGLIPEYAGLDFTEQPFIDNIAQPTGAILESERLCSTLFGSGHTLYCTCGSSIAIMAALALCLGKSKKVVAARNCHRSFANAISLLGIDVTFVAAQKNFVCEKQLYSAIKNSGAEAVYLIYSDYDGNILNLAGIIDCCRKLFVSVVVDNAHGGYLKFIEGNLHPLDCGADIVIDSAYKTLGALTPAALLHLKDETQVLRARRMLNLFSTTSPPYPVIYSICNTVRAIMEDKIDFAGAVYKTKEMKKEFSRYLIPQTEPLKIVFCPTSLSLTTEKILQIFEKFGICAELCSASRAILMPSPFNDEKDFEALSKALRVIFKGAKPINHTDFLLPMPKFGNPQSFAVFAQDICTVPLKNALARVSAEIIAPCPPGSVLLFAGEIITEEHIEFLETIGILQVVVIQ